jgi:hypothetical protein
MRACSSFPSYVAIYVGAVGCLDFAAPHEHVVIDVSVTSVARTNSNVPVVGAQIPHHGSLAVGAQQAKLDADNIRT